MSRCLIVIDVIFHVKGQVHDCLWFIYWAWPLAGVCVCVHAVFGKEPDIIILYYVWSMMHLKQVLCIYRPWIDRADRIRTRIQYDGLSGSMGVATKCQYPVLICWADARLLGPSYSRAKYMVGWIAHLSPICCPGQFQTLMVGVWRIYSLA